jgi:chemotaxis protein methyltransferase CheR
MEHSKQRCSLTSARSQPTMNEVDFARFRTFIYDRSHIFCADSQKPLFERKIRLRLMALGLTTFEEYYRLLISLPPEDEEFEKLIDVVAVHETSFFRITDHFAALQAEIFPALLSRTALNKPSPIQVWSAGCSTGEEPYSIAITFLEALAQARASVPFFTRGLNIVATDISPNVLETARIGAYQPEKVQKISQPLLDKYFEYYNHHYYVIQQIRRFGQFQLFNLINIRTLEAEIFDMVFCRNVLIYFDQTAQASLIAGLIRTLRVGGYLFLGDAESMHTFPEVARQVDLVDLGSAIIYRKRGVETS